jgi:hypothetical protein
VGAATAGALIETAADAAATEMASIRLVLEPVIASSWIPPQQAIPSERPYSGGFRRVNPTLGRI